MIERFDVDGPDRGEAHRLFRDEHVRRYRLAADAVSMADAAGGTGLLLDAACGTGHGARALVPLGGYLGLDCSLPALRRARRDHPGVEFMAADLEDLAPLPRPVRAVVSLETAEHLHNPDRFLESIHNLLAPGGGTLVFSAPTSLTRDFDRFHRHDRTAQGWRDALTGAGFAVRREVPMPFTTRFGEFFRTVPTTWRQRGSVARFWAGHPRYGLARAWEWMVLGRFSWCSTLYVARPR